MQTVQEEIHQAVGYWIKTLESSDFVTLCTQPAPDSWSLGQVYMHLIEATGFFIEQMRTCMSADEHASEKASAAAETMFRNNAFPDVRLDGPSSNALTPQPTSREAIRSGLVDLQRELDRIGALLSANTYVGKTRHPGLHYFNAMEWYRFAGMHFRHHVRQKERIEAALGRLP